MNASMKSINDSSRKIADIISVIDGITFPTDILALNVAVEAARAGEQGRGFAVPAAQVRSLAGRSAYAAKQIENLINASVERVEQGMARVNQAGVTTTEIVSSIQRVTDTWRNQRRQPRAESRRRWGWSGGQPDGPGDAAEQGLPAGPNARRRIHHRDRLRAVVCDGELVQVQSLRIGGQVVGVCLTPPQRAGWRDWQGTGVYKIADRASCSLQCPVHREST